MDEQQRSRSCGDIIGSANHSGNHYDNSTLRIGDEVFIHGYVDEIRKDTIIIRNGGGYFGTIREEVRRAQNDKL